MLKNLSKRTDFEYLLNAQITLPGKPHRQYLILGLNAGQRAAAIVDYYHYIDSLSALDSSGHLPSPMKLCCCN